MIIACLCAGVGGWRGPAPWARRWQPRLVCGPALHAQCSPSAGRCSHRAARPPECARGGAPAPAAVCSSRGTCVGGWHAQRCLKQCAQQPQQPWAGCNVRWFAVPFFVHADFCSCSCIFICRHFATQDSLKQAELYCLHGGCFCQRMNENSTRPQCTETSRRPGPAAGHAAVRTPASASSPDPTHNLHAPRAQRGACVGVLPPPPATAENSLSECKVQDVGQAFPRQQHMPAVQGGKSASPAAAARPAAARHRVPPLAVRRPEVNTYLRDTTLPPQLAW